MLDAGKPIIATDEGRLRDIIGGVHGWKVAQGDSESLKDAIVQAVNTCTREPERFVRMGQAVREMADSLSWDRISDQHLSAYRKVCSFWGVHPSDATGALASHSVPGDYMEEREVLSSTGAEEE